MVKRKELIQAEIFRLKARVAMQKNDPVALLDSLMGLMPDLQSIRGHDGLTPRAGVDYFTPNEQERFKKEIERGIIKPKNGNPGIRGPKGDKGNSIAGPPGPPGKTPAVGVDYYTDEEKWAFIERVKEDVLPMLREEIAKMVQDAIAAVPKIIERTSLPQISLIGRSGGQHIVFRNNGGVEMQDIQTIDFGSGLTIARSAPGYLLVTAAGGSGANIATDDVAATTSGANVTIDLTTLSHSFVAIQLVFRNGQALPPVASAPADGSSGYKIVGTTLTVYNATNTDDYLVSYTY